MDIPVDKYISLASAPAAAFLSMEEENAVIPESTSNEVDLDWFKENYTLVDKEGIPVEDDVLTGQEGRTVDEIADAVGSTASGKISGQADIVFVIDSTGSMYGAINNIVRNIDTFVDTLAANYSVKANFALIDYKDITCGEKTILVKNGYSNRFNDVAGFKSHVNRILVTGGGDGPETPIDGLAMAHSLDFRHSANKFVILVTDANYKINNTYGIGSMDEMSNLLADADIVTSVISARGYQSLYSSLYTKTNGVFGDIYGNFSSVLLKLDRPLSSDGYSFDSDSLSDKEELGEAQERDLTKFIKAFLKAYSVPEALYEDQTSITVYKYIYQILYCLIQTLTE